jgi:hypothetical protein
MNVRSREGAKRISEKPFESLDVGKSGVLVVEPDYLPDLEVF